VIVVFVENSVGDASSYSDQPHAVSEMAELRCSFLRQFQSLPVIVFGRRLSVLRWTTAHRGQFRGDILGRSPSPHIRLDAPMSIYFLVLATPLRILSNALKFSQLYYCTNSINLVGEELMTK